MGNSQLLPTVKPQVRAHMPTAANEPQPCGTDSGPTPLRRPLAPSGTGHLPRLPNRPEATHRTRAPAPVPGQDAGPPATGLNRRTASGNPHQPRTFGPRLPGAPSGKPTRRLDHCGGPGDVAPDTTRGWRAREPDPAGSETATIAWSHRRVAGTAPASSRAAAAGDRPGCHRCRPDRRVWADQAR